jgi:integrase/recombinase XerD
MESKYSLEMQLSGYLLDTSAQNFSHKTQERVKLALKLFAQFQGGIPDVRKVSDSDLRRFIVALRQRTLWQGRKQAKDKPLSDETVRTYAKSVKEFWLWLYQRKAIKKNPMAEVPLPRVGRKKPRYLTDDELQAIFKAVADDPRAQALVFFLLDSGARIGEVTGTGRYPGLFMNDVDLQSGCIQVRGKFGIDREVHVHPLMAQAFRLYFDHVRPEPVGQDKVFLNQDGTPMSEIRAQHLIAAVGLKAKMKRRLSPHMFRHSYAVLALKFGAPTEYVRRELGHRDISTTQGYLEGVTDQQMADAHRTFSPLANLLSHGKKTKAVMRFPDSHPLRGMPRPKSGEGSGFCWEVEEFCKENHMTVEEYLQA